MLENLINNCIVCHDKGWEDKQIPNYLRHQLCEEHTKTILRSLRRKIWLSIREAKYGNRPSEQIVSQLNSLSYDELEHYRIISEESLYSIKRVDLDRLLVSMNRTHGCIIMKQYATLPSYKRILKMFENNIRYVHEPL